MISLVFRGRAAADQHQALDGAGGRDVEDDDRAVADRLRRGGVRVPHRPGSGTVAVAGIGVIGELVPAVARLVDCVVGVGGCQGREIGIVDQAQIPGGDLRGGIELGVEQLVVTCIRMGAGARGKLGAAWSLKNTPGVGAG